MNPSAATPAATPAITRSDCHDLNNIKYRTMLYNKTIIKEHTNTDECLADLDNFLEAEKNTTEQVWTKLNKTVKLQKLIVYADVVAKRLNYDADEKNLLVAFFRTCLDHKRLSRARDVVYDTKSGAVTDVPILIYNQSRRHFTLRVVDKHTTTIKATMNRHSGAATIAAASASEPSEKM